jgi:filamentous hemagglutinin
MGCIEDFLYGRATEVSGGFDDFMLFLGLAGAGKPILELVDVAYGCATGGAAGCLAGIVFTGSSSEVAESTAVRVFRVEGNVNRRIRVLENGYVEITDREKMLFLNFGDPDRAAEFFDARVSQGMEGATIKSFDVQFEFLEYLRGAAVPEQFSRQFPNAPLVVDVTKAADQYGLRPEQIENLLDYIIQGTGSVYP